MARKLKIDRVLFTATLLLICVSIVMVYSASAVVALERFQQPYLFLTKQALWSVLGLAVLGVAMRVDYRTYRNEAFVWALLALVLTMLVAVLFSAPVNGTRRWFGVGGLGIQPSELAKIAWRERPAELPQPAKAEAVSGRQPARGIGHPPRRPG